MSKEHRVGPQLTVGLLATATGFPLEVVAEAGMLSAANLLARSSMIVTVAGRLAVAHSPERATN